MLYKQGIKALAFTAILLISSSWGFFAHKKINWLATFTLPPEMIGFYKKHIDYITETSCNPDRRRYAMKEEAPRHYIDLDDYGDSALSILPKRWDESVKKFSEDSLQAHGILPWHLMLMQSGLRDAFFMRDPQRILRYSAELGHYLADAHVPLHTTSNYDGQKTGQNGLHGFWESRLPELYFPDYNFVVGKADYVKNIQQKIWDIISTTNRAVDSVFQLEKELSEKSGGIKYSFEAKGKQTLKVYSREYSREYHQLLNGMVERQMRRAVKAVGDFWYTAWVDAGQPDLKQLINYTPTVQELADRKEELKKWKETLFKPRVHEEEGGN